ncbi:MAG: EamA family transporter [Alphaproteobacteria bacterium]|nr:EamA family transporter [Alphaproteobacteria bacterium]
MTAEGGRRRATLIGAGAIAIWATLAVLTGATGTAPPFQVMALAFAVAFGLGLVYWLVRGENPARRLRLSPAAWGLGIFGLFGYHALYFIALKFAPPVEANLINYLWPLLIVVFAGFLPGERLGALRLLGALVGFAGAALLVARGSAGLGYQADFLPGYLSGLACAFVWALYSVLSRRFAHVASDAVIGYCGATAILAALCHLAFEAWQPMDGTGWLGVVLLGVGPTGAAFLLWDIGMKRGDIQLLGALAYATPVLSTLLLILAGQGEASATVALACAAVTIGAILASRGGRAGNP